MAKWGYLRRAYAIKEYAYYRSIQDYTQEGGKYASQQEMDAELDKLPCVVADVKDVLQMATEQLDDSTEHAAAYRTVRQCKKFLADFE